MFDQWNKELLYQTPKVWLDEEVTEPGVQSLFYESLPYQGKPTRSFAYMGVPKVPSGEAVPGMVLVHGGGGTAFADWVRLWNSRGYAAIAMDNCGALPKPDTAPRPRHDYSGPKGWETFPDSLIEPTEQWPYHAVCDVILAHSLLRSQPGVDPDRIGLTGISWGGVLSCIACGVDERFRFTMPVYGCGFLGDNSTWMHHNFPALSQELCDRWVHLWDPGDYLKKMDKPMCWVTGTNDFAFPLDSLKKSYSAPSGEKSLCVRHEMPHGHGGAGENPQELKVFADHYLKGEQPLAKITGSGVQDGSGKLWATYSSGRPIMSAEILYTRAQGYWPDRKYCKNPATIDRESCRVEASIPPFTTVCFLNLYDDRDCVVSTEHVCLNS